MRDTEKSLIAGCLARDKKAWDTFVSQYSPLVYHTINSTLALYRAEPSREEIEDLYQEFFVRLLRDEFKKLRQFKGERGCSLASWLRIVAARLTIDYLRKSPPKTKAAVYYAPSDAPDPLGCLIDSEKEDMVLHAIRSLPPRDRLLLNLCYRQALPPQQIAGILKISIAAVYTQKTRLLAKLRDFLTKSYSS
jgi:RNA polymerase sigma factor (sigma-70 family)